MKSGTEESRAVEVFVDVNGHKLTADIIRKHSTNQRDIREFALKGLNLTGCRQVLDLGCGFGFFSAALKGRVHPEAAVRGVDIVKEYEPLFLETCRDAGLKGEFSSSGISILDDLRDRSIDLILCSYALYFFPDWIGDLARILKQDGFLVAVTHHRQSLREVIRIARDFFTTKGLLRAGEILPIEELIGRFSSENGSGLLSRWFREVRAMDFANSMFFRPGDLPHLLEYFRFKWPFFHSCPRERASELIGAFESHIEEILSHASNGLAISKDDMVFICTKPLQGKRS